MFDEVVDCCFGEFPCINIAVCPDLDFVVFMSSVKLEHNPWLHVCSLKLTGPSGAPTLRRCCSWSMCDINDHSDGHGHGHGGKFLFDRLHSDLSITGPTDIIGISQVTMQFASGHYKGFSNSLMVSDSIAIHWVDIETGVRRGRIVVADGFWRCMNFTACKSKPLVVAQVAITEENCEPHGDCYRFYSLCSTDDTWRHVRTMQHSAHLGTPRGVYYRLVGFLQDGKLLCSCLNHNMEADTEVDEQRRFPVVCQEVDTGVISRHGHSSSWNSAMQFVEDQLDPGWLCLRSSGSTHGLAVASYPSFAGAAAESVEFLGCPICSRCGENCWVRCARAVPMPGVSFAPLIVSRMCGAIQFLSTVDQVLMHAMSHFRFAWMAAVYRSKHP